jgi:hypothetical protein
VGIQFQRPELSTARMNMNSSLEQAMSYFNRWKDEKTKLDFVYSGHAASFIFTGFLSKVTLDEGLVAVTDESPGVMLKASLGHARFFDFTDPREAPEENRRLVNEDIECVWEITFRDGDKLDLYES